MPIYEYRCENDHTFEVLQRMTDDPVQTCEVCGAPVQRVFHPIAVHFKGSGFYNTDYGTKKRAREKEASKDSSSATKDTGGSGSETKKSSDTGGSGDSAKKPADSATPKKSAA
jgi:putative FmdB family regulatory protein